MDKQDPNELIPDFGLEDYLAGSTQGRKNIGEYLPVEIYRLLQYSLKNELVRRFGKSDTADIFRAAGYQAGVFFANHKLDLTLPFGKFAAELQRKLEESQIGILRIEKQEAGTGRIILTVSEDADCSGLPVMGESVCNFDEGFISGILSTYTKRSYEAVEVNCWALGDRVCRFDAQIKGE